MTLPTNGQTPAPPTGSKASAALGRISPAEIGEPQPKLHFDRRAAAGVGITQWHGCYDSSWRGLINPQSFAHPAKFSRGLIERIFDHCLKRGYLRPGEVVGDAFGGIGTGGIVAAYRGLHWIGCELEPRFVGFAADNFALHHPRWRDLGVPMPRIVQGDSRRFHEVVASAGAVVSSPPYAHIAAGAGGLNTKPAKRPGQQSGRSAESASQTADQRYGDAAGQIAGLPEGEVQAVITSPPYAATSGKGGGGINVKGYVPANGRKWTGEHADPVGSRTYQGQAGDRAEGNIETLQPGDLNGVVTSPPYGETLDHGGGPDTKQDKIQGGKSLMGMKEGYGNSLAQISGDGETYWQAMAQVYASCFLAIRPGGVLVVVVKDYVQKGKRVPLCDDTARLLEHCGLEPLERIHAMLTKSTTHGDLFNGETVTTKSRKSFFRRLAEKKGSPAIDYEEVLIYRRP